MGRDILFYFISSLLFFAVGCEKKPPATPEALCHVVRAGNIKRVREIINSGVDLGKDLWPGWTPLHDAAKRGYKNLVELMISKGLDVNAKTEDGETPMDIAFDVGHKNIVELLKFAGGQFGRAENADKHKREINLNFGSPVYFTSQGNRRSHQGLQRAGSIRLTAL